MRITINKIKFARDVFKGLGIPVTQQRLAVYARLAGSLDHPSAESIHAALKRRNPGLSLATVYKTLQTLQRVGLAGVVNAPHAQARYDAVTGVHHHAICTACGAIEDLFDKRLDKLKIPRAAKGFSVATFSVHFHGVCRNCRGARGRSKFNKL